MRNPAWPPLQSHLAGLAWPAVPGQQGLLLATLLAQMEQSQWMPAAAIEQAQMIQLRLLVEHARRHSRFYAERLAGFHPERASGLQECMAAIPLLSSDAPRPWIKPSRSSAANGSPA